MVSHPAPPTTYPRYSAGSATSGITWTWADEEGNVVGSGSANDDGVAPAALCGGTTGCHTLEVGSYDESGEESDAISWTLDSATGEELATGGAGDTAEVCPATSQPTPEPTAQPTVLCYTLYM